MKKKLISSIFICILIFLFYDLSYGFFGKSGWKIFRKAQSAKTYGVTAVCGVRGDLSGMFFNPAVLGTGVQREIFFLSELGSSDDRLIGLVYGEPLRKSMVAGGLIYYDCGTMELNWLEDGMLKTKKVSAQSDLFGLVSYGRELRENLYTGASVKFATSKIIEKVSALAFAFDLGVFYIPIEKLGVSGAIQNVGISTKFVDKANPLPTSTYISCGYLIELNKAYFVPGAGVIYNFMDEDYIPDINIELGYYFASLNFGYLFNVEESNLHLGIGVTWKNIDFGYALKPGFFLDNTHRVSMGYRFGKAISSE